MNYTFSFILVFEVIFLNFERVYALRKNKKMTQNELSALLNMNPNDYMKFESGNLNVPASILFKLANFYQVSADYLLDRTSIKTPYPKK